MRVHQHRWRGSCQYGVLHAVCIKCGLVTFNPWWPKWRLADRYETPENVESPLARASREVSEQQDAPAENVGVR